MHNFFQKKLFFRKTILYILSLEKQFTKNQYLKILNESLSFSEAVVRKCPIIKLLITFCQSSLATLIKKRLRRRCISVNLAKFLKNPILQNTCKWLVLDFEQFCMSHSIIHFIKRNSKKGNYYFLNVFNRISTSENYRQKK